MKRSITPRALIAMLVPLLWACSQDNAAFSEPSEHTSKIEGDFNGDGITDFASIVFLDNGDATLVAQLDDQLLTLRSVSSGRTSNLFVDLADAGVYAAACSKRVWQSLRERRGSNFYSSKLSDMVWHRRSINGDTLLGRRKISV